MLDVRVIPSKHAYFPGERIEARIEFRRDAPRRARGRAFPRGIHTRKVSVVSTPSQEEAPTEPLPTIQESPTDGAVTIAFATVRMTGHVVPSTTYIPPEPFLPLRQVLLHQPIGSGDGPTTAASGGGIDFSPGVDGTLAGSLSGLARGLIGGKEGGTWEERKRSVWAGKALPVWVAGREVVGVDLEVGEEGLCCESGFGVEF
jgi:hypothetical protein